jgi:3'-phosphoadenosine 5'-phosphosulfate sulfotransferase (PAPS reductase)/FAD synthetase
MVQRENGAKQMNIINFSGGRTSAYMAKRLIDEGITNYIVTFQNTGKEMPQTLDFINECDKQWNLNIVWLEYRKNLTFDIVNYENASRNGEPFDYLLEHKKGILPNNYFRFCTLELKINTLKRYLKSMGIKDFISYNGIRYDEPQRWSKAQEDTELPLVKWKITKQDVLNFWQKQNFDLKLNEPYGNCDCCFLKGKGKLAIIAKEKPELFDWWISKEQNSQYQFKKEISYNQLKNKAQSQLGIFDNDPDFHCFCNID